MTDRQVGRMTASHLLLLSCLHALALTFTTQNPQDVYRHHRYPYIFQYTVL